MKLLAAEKKGSVLVVSFVQDMITLQGNDDFKEDLAQVLDRGIVDIVLDLSHVVFISSIILASLIYFVKKIAEKDGRLKLCGLQEKTREIFTITNLDKIFEIYQTTEEALSSFRPRAS